MYYVYVLKSLKDNKHYIGYSQDATKRLEEHNAGNVESTRYRKPFEIIYTEEYETSSEARQRELTIKKMKNGIQFIKELINARE